MIGRITVIIKMFKWFFILFPVFNLALLNDHSLYNHLWEGLLNVSTFLFRLVSFAPRMVGNTDVQIVKESLH